MLWSEVWSEKVVGAGSRVRSSQMSPQGSLCPTWRTVGLWASGAGARCSHIYPLTPEQAQHSLEKEDVTRGLRTGSARWFSDFCSGKVLFYKGVYKNAAMVVEVGVRYPPKLLPGRIWEP